MNNKWKFIVLVPGKVLNLRCSQSWTELSNTLFQIKLKSASSIRRIMGLDTMLNKKEQQQMLFYFQKLIQLLVHVK